MADSTHTKHRPSKIDQLPDDIKSQLNVLLREGRMTQQKIRDEVNQIIVDSGVDSEPEYIKRNALSRYSQAQRKAMERYQEAQDFTKYWVGQYGELPQTDISRGLIEMLKEQAFRVHMDSVEKDKTLDPKTLNNLALTIKRLNEAQAGSVKLEKEIRKQALEDAANKAESVAKKAGLTSDTVKLLKAELLGIQ
ncbi:DUF3486 family protein [Vibrio nomapromontoriensis]|uniref:DUF3486 family protein n=1 Tax=Vibrio nomapromontoriensis TaxID=2910246 RepID=UPI003D09DCD6